MIIKIEKSVLVGFGLY